MSYVSINGVGFCAYFSTTGDWAFNYALDLSRKHNVKLNVFYFLSDPYGMQDDDTALMSAAELSHLQVEKERGLRFYYEERSGDYINVGFRLCRETGWIELNHCLMSHEFQVLVLGFPGYDASFSGRPIREFADALICPVVLVGPERADQFHLNSRAVLIEHQLAIPERKWVPIESMPA